MKYWIILLLDNYFFESSVLNLHNRLCSSLWIGFWRSTGFSSYTTASCMHTISKLHLLAPKRFLTLLLLGHQKMYDFLNLLYLIFKVNLFPLIFPIQLKRGGKSGFMLWHDFYLFIHLLFSIHFHFGFLIHVSQILQIEVWI